MISKETQQARKAQGLCVKCGGPRTPCSSCGHMVSTYHCRRCWEKAHAMYEARKLRSQVWTPDDELPDADEVTA